MIGAVSAADENLTDDNLEIADDISVDDEAVASFDADEIDEDNILQQEDADLQDTLGDDVPFSPGMAELPDYPDGYIRVLEGSHKEIVAKFINKANQEPAANKTIGLSIGEEYPLEVETDSDGYGSFVVDVPEGDYILYIVNPNNGRLRMASVGSNVVEINVLNANTPSSIHIGGKENYPMIAGEDLTLNVVIKDPVGDLIPNSSISYTIGNISGELNSTDGSFNLVISSLPIGEYNLSVYCPQINMTKSVGIYVLSEPAPTVIADNFIMVYGDGSEYTVKVTDECGLPLSGAQVGVKGYYGARSDENGVANFKVTLDVGVYTVEIVNYNTYKSIIRNITVLAKPSVNVDENITLDNENKFSISFSDVNGNPLANASVSLIVGEDNYSFTTDENGTAIFDLGFLAPGNHTLTIVNPVTGEKIIREVNIPKVDTQISAPNVSTVYNGGGYLVITLKDANNAVLAGKSISVVLNGKIIKGVTDANGQFKVSTDGLAPKAYTATMTFAGDDYLVNSTATANVVVKKATPKMTAKKATFKAKKKTKKYSIVLKDNKNKAMKKVKVTLKVGKKTYKATTNSKGKATFKITKLTKKGKYTAKVKFAGNKNYNAMTKKVKITVKK